MGNLWTLDESPRKFSILLVGCQKFPGIYSSFSDLAKPVHRTMLKFLGVCGEFTDA